MLPVLHPSVFVLCVVRFCFLLRFFLSPLQVEKMTSRSRSGDLRRRTHCRRTRLHDDPFLETHVAKDAMQGGLAPVLRMRGLSQSAAVKNMPKINIQLFTSVYHRLLTRDYSPLCADMLSGL